MAAAHVDVLAVTEEEMIADGPKVILVQHRTDRADAAAFLDPVHHPVHRLRHKLKQPIQEMEPLQNACPSAVLDETLFEFGMEIDQFPERIARLTAAFQKIFIRWKIL